MARQLYEKQEWEDLPSENTPLSAERLEHIEQGIRDNSENMALKEKYRDDGIDVGRAPSSTVGGRSTAIGTNNQATSECSIALGRGNKVYGGRAVALGRDNTASGDDSIAAGYNNQTNGVYAVSLGTSNSADGHCVALGSENVAKNNSYAIGSTLIANGNYQFVTGIYNAEEPDKVFIVGKGTYQNRKNIFTIDADGNAIFASNVQGTVQGKSISFATLLTEMENRYNGLQQQIQGISNELVQLAERIVELEANQNPTEGGETT